MPSLEPIKNTARKGQDSFVGNLIEGIDIPYGVDTVNDEPKEAVKYMAKILAASISESLDVCMISGGLCKEIYDDLFEEQTGHSFADYVEASLSNGSKVEILLWASDFSDELVSPKIKNLLKRSQAKGSKYNFSIQITGTSELSTEMSHFLLAYDTGKNKYYIRAESPHTANSVDLDPCDRFEMHVPASIHYNTKLAKKSGSAAISLFRKLYGPGKHTGILSKIAQALGMTRAGLAS